MVVGKERFVTTVLGKCYNFFHDFGANTSMVKKTNNISIFITVTTFFLHVFWVSSGHTLKAMALGHFTDVTGCCRRKMDHPWIQHRQGGASCLNCVRRVHASHEMDGPPTLSCWWAEMSAFLPGAVSSLSASVNPPVRIADTEDSQK